MYRIAIGNDFTQSRPLTAVEMDAALEMLSDVFGDRLYVAQIESQPNLENRSQL